MSDRRSPSLAERWVNAAGAWVDRTAVDLALDLGRRPGREKPDPEQQLRQLSRVAEAYGDAAYVTNPDAFFVPPAAPRVRRASVRSLPDGGAVEDLSFPSSFVPVHPFPRDEYLAFEANRVAHARRWRHPTPRPAVVCIHGYLGGNLSFEEISFEAMRLYGWGLDVLVAVLPFHGLRAPPGRRGMFPGSNPWRAVEGFAQSIGDLRAWSAWLRGEGSSAVGAFGMSLGGYTTGLWATVDPTVDFAAMMIPLASIGDAYLEHRAGRADAVPDWVPRRIDQALAVVSPFARASKVAPSRALVLAAANDRITPRGHAERLRAHFDARLDTFAGGHLLQLGRRRAFATLREFLGDAQILPPAR